MAKVIAICTSPERGTKKRDVGQAEFKADYGIVGDAHAGNWHRQVSFLSYQRVLDFKAKGAVVTNGDFGENVVVDGIDFKTLPIGTKLSCGELKFEITQIGKKCHSHCEIYKTMGDCIMPREGVFAKVLQGGIMKAGDEIVIEGVD